ncbi:MAG: translational GTPase TypA [Azospirillum brasilense]|nr:MAG: translational GTPase TypA [Azospirillum brasilense]
MSGLRNIAIIAHVDHGKTTLIDVMLRQAGTFRDNQRVDERVMDSNDLEKERGITILAKCTSIQWKDTRINIIDTPGHADFGGEVERILSMVDGVLVLVDAAEGPMPQTKFVLMKALAQGLRPIVVVNKVDRPDARVEEVVNEVFDLFVALDANDAQLDFPIIYASGRNGWAVKDLAETNRENLHVIMDEVVRHVEAPDADPEAHFAMLTTLIESDNFLGRILTGKVESGTAKVGMPVKALRLDGTVVEQGRITKLLSFDGIERVPVNEAPAGSIISIAGLTNATVADTVCTLEVNTPLRATPIDPPTMAITIAVNDSPLAGTEGTKVTSRMIRDRLYKEAEGNVAITVKDSENGDAFEVGGRGELQLGVLIETMRREGYELSVSRPRVLLKKDESGQTIEPIEEVQADVDEEFSGVVVEKLSLRKGNMIDMRPSSGGKVRLKFLIPARGMIGYQGEFLTDTRGSGVLSRLFHGYAPYKGDIPGRRNGVLISNDTGVATDYALWGLEERGYLIIPGGVKVYQGMIIGQHNRENDLEVNALKAKQLTNIRTTSKDEAVRLTPARVPTLEQAIAYIEEDELMEVTPKNIRLRKRYLDPNMRKRMEKAKTDVA